MKKQKKNWVFPAVFILILSVTASAQVRLTGEITGIVTDGKNEPLPGVTVTLTGEKLFQKSLTVISNEKGIFRFLNLNPGSYEVNVSLPGFSSLKIAPVVVSVGRSASLTAKLTEAKINQEVVVNARAPLIETKSVQTSTNFTVEAIQQIPTNRNIQDLMEATPAINDYGAYGAGSKISKDYYQGSAANSYLLNGVDISDAYSGTTWVNPNYDTIEEIQVVGVGASAEYGNFTGAVLNVITKTGTNAFHGGLSSYYTGKALCGDNSGGIVDLSPDVMRYNTETTAFLGGPLIKEKLFFFLAGGYTGYQNRRYDALAYGKFGQPHFQASVNWLPSAKHSLNFMINLDPLNHDNLGLQLGSGPEIGYSRKFRSTVWNGSWRYLISDKTILETRYAGFRGRDLTDPVSPDVPAILDGATGRYYGSSGSYAFSTRNRHQINTVLTQYLDDFLNMSHEIKLGFEYESSKADDDVGYTGGGQMFEMYYIMPGLYIAVGYDNYLFNLKAKVDRIGGFFQDNIRAGKRLTLNLGLRLDTPRLTAEGLSGAIVKYTNVAPRIGFSYDFTGDAKNVLHVGFGRYYDKMTTETFASAMPGYGDISYYIAYLTSGLDTTPEGLAAFPSLVIRPENLAGVVPAGQLTPVSSKLLSGPYSDVLNVRFEKAILKDFAMSLEYIHREDRNLLCTYSTTVHSYRELEWTDPWLGHTITIWEQTDNEPDNYVYGNSDWAKRRHNFAILTLNKRDNGKWSLMTSLTFQDSQGNVDNQYASTGGVDGASGNPNYTQSPFVWGKLRFDRTWQFKMLGTYHLPLGIDIAGDFHALSGVAWEPMIGSQFTGVDMAVGRLLLEKRGSRRAPGTWFFNFRIAKEFHINASRIELMADLMNVFNRANAASVAYEPYAVFPISGTTAFGKVFQLSEPFHARFGVRWSF